MLVLFRMLKHTLGFGFLLALVLFASLAVRSRADAATCGFRCQVVYGGTTSVDRCATDNECAADCRAQCQGQGWAFDQRTSPTCDQTSGNCQACYCVPGIPRTCDAQVAASGDAQTECTNICTSVCQPTRQRLATPATAVRCSTGAGATYPPRCVTAQLDVCRVCINRCVDGGGVNGTVAVPADCFQRCSNDGADSPCRGIPQEQALQGMTSAPSGAISGSGERRSNIQSGVSPSASEAAALAAGECAIRAVRADAANGSLIRMVEALSTPEVSYASTTWTCRRVCSNTQESSCVTGGCPGDSAIRCCPQAMNIGAAPTQQCGAVGASNGGTDGGPAGTAGGDASSGSGDAGSSGGTPSGSSGASNGGSNSGSSGSSVVGASSVAADSGGLTRLILPACVEDGACQFSDLVQVALNAIRFLFGLAGVLLLVAFVYAGIEYLIAGDAASVKSATERLQKAILGLFIMFFGYTLVSFLVGIFVQA